MQDSKIHVVTGAFGFSGKYIARRLLDAGYQVRTLTNSPNRHNPFEGRIEAHPLNFDNPAKLVESLREAEVLYNNYWVRFNHRDFTYSQAIENTLILFRAARDAGIKRIVHISVTNPSESSAFEYFRGKARLEEALREMGIPYSILRPALLFGKEDILINNIAWFLRRFPVFGVFGDGKYRLQPIYVDDLAELAVEEGRKGENRIVDATGPETFTYRELVEEIGRIIGYPRPVVSIPRDLGYFLGAIVGRLFKDVTITHDEIEGLMAGLLYTDSPPVGKTRLTEWAREHAPTLGLHYANELARRKNRTAAYEEL
jgi:uncharacterized protein YbjT (DUF2867 family)